MALTDTPESEHTITDVCNEIRESMGQVVSIAEVQLHRVRSLVRTYGRPDISGELGDDAAALLSTYAKLKEAIEAAKEITVKICQRKTGDRRPETVGKEETNVFLQPAVSSL